MNVSVYIYFLQVCDELMSIELRLVEKFDALVDEFDTRLNELKNVALEAQQLFFRAVEEQEDKFSTQLRAVATDLIERLAREVRMYSPAQSERI